MSLKQILEEKLQAAFTPSLLEVIDQSHLHQGHLGDALNHETHFKIIIVSAAFKGLSRLECHKKVYEALGEKLNKIHALSLSLKSP